MKAASRSASWLGGIPEHWEIAPLSTHFDERTETVSDRDFPPLSVTKDGIVSQLATAAKTGNNDHRKLVRKGDFVINSRSDRKGSSGISPVDGSVSVINTVLTPRISIHPRFAHHLLRSEAFQEEFYRWGNGIVADLWSTRYSVMKSIPLGLPPTREKQQLIADYLDRETAQIDLLIEEQQRLVSLLQERRSALLSQALPSLSQSPSRLKHLARVQTGITLSGEGAPDDPEWPYLRVANVQVGHVEIEEIKTLRVSAEAAKQAMLVAGDVLMTEGGDIDKLGRAALWHGEIPTILHQNHIFAVRPSSRLHPEYLVYWLEGPIARHYFRTTAKKTTNLASTNKWTLGNLQIQCPALDEQLRIVAYLDEQTAKIDTLIAETERFIELARERRSVLITAAVTGQIDVRDMVA